jgi:dihydrolipoamide dehydrogenase
MLLSETLPKSIAILGAGAIGMEFAYILSSFGTKVTVVELMDQVLPWMTTIRQVWKRLLPRGVVSICSARAKKAEVTGREPPSCSAKDETKTEIAG